MERISDMARAGEPDINGNCRGTRYRQNNESKKRYPGQKYRPKKYNDTSDSDGSSSDEGRDDMPDRKKGQGYRRKKNHRRLSRRGRGSSPEFSSRDFSSALSELLHQLSGRNDTNFDDDKRRQRQRRSKRRAVRPMSEQFFRS